MDSFEIIMTPDATTDLLELRDYISDSLLSCVSCSCVS